MTILEKTYLKKFTQIHIHVYICAAYTLSKIEIYIALHVIFSTIDFCND